MISHLLGHVGQISQNNTGRFPPVTNVAQTSTQSSEEVSSHPMPMSGYLANWYIKASATPGAGTRWVFTLVKNGVDTAMTVNMDGPSSVASDTTHVIAFNAGDTISIRVAPFDLDQSPIASEFYYSFDISAAGQALLTGPPTTSQSASVTSYLALQASNINTSTAGATTIIPTSGVIRSMYAKQGFSNGAGTSRTFTLVVNGVDTALTCTIADTATTANDTVHSVVVNPGDTAYWKCVPTNTPTVRPVHIGALFVPDAGGEAMQTSVSGTNLTTGTGNQIAGIRGGSLAYGTTGVTHSNYIGTAASIRKLWFQLDADPAGTATRTARVRSAQSNTSLVATISAGATLATDLTNTATLTVPDYLDINIVGANTPVATTARVSYVTYTSQGGSPGALGRSMKVGAGMSRGDTVS